MDSSLFTLNSSLKELVRPNILALEPYSSARDEYSGGKASVFLDANESPYNPPLNRYPDPLQRALKEALAPVKGVPAERIFLGNGSDEAIDLLFRLFCQPGVDNVVAMDPTYGMYEVCAHINDVAYRKVPLSADFQLDAEQMLAACDAHTKLLFICSPNNPTGNAIEREQIEKLLREFGGIVVVDEAYSDFSSQRPWRTELSRYDHLVVLNTFSKAYACAAIRLGMAFAHPDIIALFNKVKYPYNINQLTAEKALEVLRQPTALHQRIMRILESRRPLMQAFAQLPLCRKVYPTDANFFLAQVEDADTIYRYLVSQGIIVRNRSRVALCHDCLRITIGSPAENTQLLAALRRYQPHAE